MQKNYLVNYLVFDENETKLCNKNVQKHKIKQIKIKEQKSCKKNQNKNIREKIGKNWEIWQQYFGRKNCEQNFKNESFQQILE